MHSDIDDQSSIFFTGAHDFTRTYDPSDLESAQRVACLCNAAKNGNLQIVRTLLDEGFDVNETFELPDSFTYLRPLSTAILEKQADIAELFIERGAEVGNAPMANPDFGMSTIVATMQMEPKEAISRIMALEAIRVRSESALGEEDRDQRAKYQICRSPLTAACYVKSSRLVELLLNAGAEFGEWYYLAIAAALDKTIESTDAERFEILGQILGARDRIGFDRFVKATDDFEQYVNGEWRRALSAKDYQPTEVAQKKAWKDCDRLLTSPAYRQQLPLSQLLYAKYCDLSFDEIIDSITETAAIIDLPESLEELGTALTFLAVTKFCVYSLLPFQIGLLPHPKLKKKVMVAFPCWDKSEGNANAFDTTLLPALKEKAPDVEFSREAYAKVMSAIGASGDDSALLMTLQSAFESSEEIGVFKKLFQDEQKTGSLRYASLFAYPGLNDDQAEGSIYYDSAAMEAILGYWTEENLDDIKAFLKYKYASSFIELASSKVSEQTNAERFASFSSICGFLVSPELSPVYLESVLDDKAIEDLGVIFQNIKTALRNSIATSEHLSEESRQLAASKLDDISLKIVGTEGFGQELKGNLILDDRNFIDNSNRLHIMQARAEFEEAVSRNGAIDDDIIGNSWTYNAIYDLQRNDVELYAAYLLPPIYLKRRSPVMNYAAIGRVIGHELSHAFDPNAVEASKDMGLESGAVDIFSTSPAYAENIEKLKKQFEKAVPRRLAQADPFLSVTNDFDREKWIGENFADVVGLEIALYAYALSAGYSTIADLVGARPDDVKLFMQSHALSYRSKPSREWLMYQMMYDVHAPDEFRVNTVKNLDAFHAVFETKEGDGMWLNPEERVNVFGIE